MSRTIKFRAWDKRSQQMREVSGFFFGQVMFISPQENATSYTINSVPDEQVELMQFTGLFDCQSQEIYEGDILGTPGEIRTYFRVAWNENELTWIGESSWGGRFLLSMNNPGIADRVIGNIYENPGLIEKDGI